MITNFELFYRNFKANKEKSVTTDSVFHVKAGMTGWSSYKKTWDSHLFILTHANLYLANI